MAELSQMQRPLVVSAVLITGLVMGVQGAPALAGSVTEQSIWSKQNALERAGAQVPKGATITNSQCQTVEVGIDNERYICTITYDLAPAAGGSNGAKSGNP